MNIPFTNFVKQNQVILHILLADDDIDDGLLFKDAIDELNTPVELTVIHDGEQLMQWLHKSPVPPDLLFLDINMPRKNGFACLVEIKGSETLKKIPVIILSTSLDPISIRLLYAHGALHCIRKPNKFGQLMTLLKTAINLAVQTGYKQPPIEQFVLSKELVYDENRERSS